MTSNNNLIKKENSNNFIEYFGVFLLSIYPVSFFFGTGVLNITIILLDIILVIELLKKNNLKFFNCIPFYSFIIFWLILLINLFFFSIDLINSAPRTIGFIRFIFFIFVIKYFFNIYNQKYKKIILGSWTIIFLTTALDLLYEFFFGNNFLGFVSYMPGRLAGFFNDELIMGHYFYGFILIILTFLYQYFGNLKSKKIVKLNLKFKYQNLIYFFIFLFLLISMLIGERANFIKTLIIVFIFMFLLNREQIKKKIIIFFSLCILFFIVIFNYQGYKVRFVGQLISPFLKDPVNYISSSGYWDHYVAGMDVFKNNKIFGVGLKNYRIYIKDKNYKNPSIHPHQNHIEILSEIGLIGYFSLLILFVLNIYNSIKLGNFSQNLFKLSGLLFLLTSFLPLLPSGSFFTSHAATIFWMNFSFILFVKKTID